MLHEHSSHDKLVIVIFLISRFRHKKPKKAASKTATQAPMKPDETEKAAIREAPAKADAESEHAEKEYVKPKPEKTGQQTQTGIDDKTHDSAVSFIKEARSRGLSELYIKESLQQSGIGSETVDRTLRNYPKE